jgi:hypothetical protein
MARFRWIEISIFVVLTLVSGHALGWGTCELNIKLPEDPSLECDGEEMKTFEIEAEIISNVALTEGKNCNWTDRYDGLIELTRVGNKCRAMITVDKAEAYFISVSYKDNGKTKLCQSTKKLDVKPLCCVPL